MALITGVLQNYELQLLVTGLNFQFKDKKAVPKRVMGQAMSSSSLCVLSLFVSLRITDNGRNNCRGFI